MAKCSICKSCYRITWVEGKVYYCCTLCRKVMRLEGPDKLVEVKDAQIIKAVLLMMGAQI